MFIKHGRPGGSQGQGVRAASQAAGLNTRDTWKMLGRAVDRRARTRYAGGGSGGRPGREGNCGGGRHEKCLINCHAGSHIT